MTHAVLTGSRFSADVLERLSCLNHGRGFSFAHSVQNRHVRRIHSRDLKVSTRPAVGLFSTVAFVRRLRADRDDAAELFTCRAVSLYTRHSPRSTRTVMKFSDLRRH